MKTTAAVPGSSGDTTYKKGKSTMKRTINKSLLAGTALLALSGTAMAAQTDINIYGASAEFNFWKTAAQGFMTSASGFNCTSTIPADGAPALDAGSAHGILKGSGCTGAPTTDVVLRFSSKASYDGILAALAKNDPNADLSCGTSDAQLNQRKMAVLPTDASHLVASTACTPVNVGASDVPGDSFVQTSNGALNGPAGGTVTNRSFVQADGVTLGIDTTALNATMLQPVKVPFGFFVNTGVTAKTCTAGRVGDFCSTNLDCNTKAAGVSVTGTCGTAATITNMTREMASLLFSGQVKNWSTFGPAFTAQPVVLCLRHAGSGTAATLDLAVMNNGQWGSPVVTDEVATASLYSPQTWFNDGSGGEKVCITGAAGAVGFLDADSSVGASTAGPLKYNGLYPSAYGIKNGAYDFWADQSVYFPTTISANENTAARKLLSYLNSDAGLTAANYFHFWAASSTMGVTKDFEIAYPHK